jgi:hypothetical protein
VTRDFTLEKYSELLDAIKKGYTTATVEQFLKGEYKEPVIILRHDVDKFPPRAVRMANLEKSKGISSTYYFRWGSRGGGSRMLINTFANPPCKALLTQLH